MNSEWHCAKQKLPLHINLLYFIVNTNFVMVVTCTAENGLSSVFPLKIVANVFVGDPTSWSTRANEKIGVLWVALSKKAKCWKKRKKNLGKQNFSTEDIKWTNLWFSYKITIWKSKPWKFRKNSKQTVQTNQV